MRMPLYSRLVAPCILFILLIIGGQQGYVAYKGYKKVAKTIADATDAKPAAAGQDASSFSLFSAAESATPAVTAAVAPLNAEVEGIVRSDEPWRSFAVIKTGAQQQSYREGEALAGYDDAWIDEINADGVVVNYRGVSQVLALSKPDYFKGGDTSPPEKPRADTRLAQLNLNDFFVLKPLREQGRLEGYLINPRNTSAVFVRSGVEQGDVVVKVNAVDMTQAAQARSIITSWSKMKTAELVVRRHNRLKNIRLDVLAN